MKTKVLLMASLAMLGASQLKAQLNVGSSGAPDASAILQISSTTKGLRLPNVALSTTTTFTLTTATSAAAAVGMTVYNTTAGITSSNAAYPATGVGAYTWDGTGWLASKSAAANNIYTNDGTLLAARTVAQAAFPLTFSGTGGVILNSGNVGIGTLVPATKLDVTGSLGFNGAITNGRLSSQAAGILNLNLGSGGLNIDNNAGTFNVVNISNTTGHVSIGTGGASNQKLSIGSGNGSSTSPTVILMDKSYSSIAGQKPKFILFGDTTQNGSFGFGVSALQLDYIAPPSNDHVFYTNSIENMRLGSNGSFKLAKYGMGSFIGVAVNYLAVDAAGNLIEQTLNSGTAPNIYNVNGAISSARTVDMAGYTLGFKGTAGTFTFNNTGNTFGTNATSLTLTQTGDQYSSSSMKLLNRFGQNGLLITTGDLSTGVSNIGVTDIFMQTQGGGTGNVKQKQMNMRVESRSAGMYSHYQNSIDTTEMQFFNIANFGANGPAMVIGSNSVVARQSLGIAMDPNDSVRTLLSISPKTTGSKITLFDGGSLTGHYGFGVSSGQLNYDADAHVFYNLGKNGTGTELARINSNGVHLSSSSILELGYGVAKQADAGKIGYGLFTTNVLDILGGGTSTRTIKLWDNVIVPGTVTAGGTVLTSDRRLKKNIVILNGALGKVMQLQAYSYDKKASLSATKYDQKEMGFIAQDLRKVFPELVVEGTDKDKLLAVNYTALIPLLTKAIQEQQAQNDVQVAQIANLKKENAIITAQLAQVSEMKTAMAEMRKELNKMAVIKVAGSNTASK